MSQLRMGNMASSYDNTNNNSNGTTTDYGSNTCTETTANVTAGVIMVENETRQTQAGLLESYSSNNKRRKKENNEEEVIIRTEKKPKIQTLQNLITPAFVINRSSFENNCKQMLKYVYEHDHMYIRPHIKTHKTPMGCFIQATGSSNTTTTVDDNNNNNNNYLYRVGFNEDKGRNERTNIVTGFVASTLPEISMIVEASCIEPYSNVPAFYDVLYGVPISEHKLSMINQLRHRFHSLHDPNNNHKNKNNNNHNNPKQTKIHILLDHPQQLKFVEDYYSKIADNASNRNKKLKHTTRNDDEEDECCRNTSCSCRDRFSAFLKVDTGYHRAGVSINNQDGIELAMNMMIRSPAIAFMGLYSHCGHSYNASNPSQQMEIVQQDITHMNAFLTTLRKECKIICERPKDKPCRTNFVDDVLLLNIIVSVGSTPSATYYHHTKINKYSENKLVRHPIEIHPGNYVFYDRQQLYTKSTFEDDISVRVLCRVIGHYTDRNTILLDAGSTALTKDTTPQDHNFCSIPGYPYLHCYRMSQEVMVVKCVQRQPPSINTTTDPTTKSTSTPDPAPSSTLSPFTVTSDSALASCSSITGPDLITSNNTSAVVQEHPEEQPFPFDEFPIGKMVPLIPNHSCLAAACFDKFYIINDPTSQYLPTEEIIDEWIPGKI